MFSHAFALLAKSFGWRHDYILSLNSRLFFLYLREAVKLNAEDNFILHQAAAFPYIEEKEVRNKILSSFTKLLETSNEKVEDEIRDDSWKLRLGIKGFKHGIDG